MAPPPIEQAANALVAEVQRQSATRLAFYDPEGDFHLSATELVRSVVTSLREPSQQMIEAAIYEESTDPRATVADILGLVADRFSLDNPG